MVREQGLQYEPRYPREEANTLDARPDGELFALTTPRAALPVARLMSPPGTEPSSRASSASTKSIVGGKGLHYFVPAEEVFKDKACVIVGAAIFARLDARLRTRPVRLSHSCRRDRSVHGVVLREAKSSRPRARPDLEST